LSGNVDSEVGDALANLVDTYGANMMLDIAHSGESGISVEADAGYTVMGMGSSVQDYYNHMSFADYNDVDVLVIGGITQDLQDIQRYVQARKDAKNTKRLLLVIHRTKHPDVLKHISHNFVKGVQVMAIEPPQVDEMLRVEFTHNVAAFCGTKVINSGSGLSWKDVFADSKNVGHVQSVKFNSNMTSFIGGAGTDEEINARAEFLESVADSNPAASEIYKTLAATLKGKFVKLLVGAATSAEFTERMHRITDARYAIAQAVEGGIIPGSGNSFMWACTKIEDENKSFEAGYNMMMEAACEPYKQLRITSGVELPEIVQDPWIGQDLRTLKTGNMMVLGIIDPLGVSLNVLNASASIAEMFIRTSSIVCV
jgi:chaperonin GroEL